MFWQRIIGGLCGAIGGAFLSMIGLTFAVWCLNLVPVDSMCFVVWAGLLLGMITGIAFPHKTGQFVSYFIN